MQLKETILKTLESFGNGSDVQQLKRQVEQTQDSQKLFLMYQAIREAYLKEFTGKVNAPFQVHGPNGKVVMVRNLDEYLKLSGERHEEVQQEKKV